MAFLDKFKSSMRPLALFAASAGVNEYGERAPSETSVAVRGLLLAAKAQRDAAAGNGPSYRVSTHVARVPLATDVSGVVRIESDEISYSLKGWEVAYDGAAPDHFVLYLDRIQ